jgi:hypothetical protein
MSALQPLWRIDSQLQELLEYRQSRTEDPDTPATAEELAAVDGEIDRYMQTLAKKVDGVAGLLLEWKARREAITSERARLKTLLERIEARDARLRDYVAMVMGRQPTPGRGPRRLRGSTSELVLRANGGPVPLLVNQPELVPDELKTVEVTLRYDLWQQLLRGAARELADGIRADARQKITLSNALIRQELEKPCVACGGAGCAECGNTGSKSVPGAYLGDRESWIEIR